jgi:Na/Pi-cotransporter
MCAPRKCVFSWITLPAALALLLTACGGPPPPPDILLLDEYASGDEQAAPQDATLAQPFRVVVEGPVEPGLLGGKGSRRGVRGITVRFSIINPATGATFAESGAPVAEVTTDPGGAASARMQLADWSGDIWVEVSVPGHPTVKPLRMRAMAGVEKIGSDLETTTGGTIEEIGVRLQNPNGTPAQGIEVFFRVEGGGEGSSVKHGRVLTDADGRAITSWKLGKSVQQYYASAEIRDTREAVSVRDRFDVRAIEFKAMGMNKLHLLTILVGGLAVFIFGMTLMSQGIQRMADRRLKSILQFMTQNRFMGALAGTIITAVIQSSSATTVMMVGFVNAGMMTLTQAVGVVFGANIGTTMTAQLIAFKLDALSYPAIALGLLLMGFAKRPQFKSLGKAILGFGLLFLGMMTMSDVLKPLRNSPEFISWFQMFDCTPVNGGIMPVAPTLMCIVIGTLATCMIQSSSATVGLVQALCGQGLISFYTAVPLILGDNIGTTITANLSALSANRNAKRVAMAHTLFNLIGTAYMYVLFFVPLWHGQPLFLGFVDWITPGEVFSAHPENLVRHAANAHTAFNMLNMLMFLPFVHVLTRACQTIIPMGDADRDTVLQYLEPKLLQSPSIALAQAVKEVVYMVRKGQNSMNDSCALLCGGPASLEPKILEREELIDRLQQEITEYLVALSRKNLEPAESALIPALIHAVNDAERLGDHAESMVELQRLLAEGAYEVSPEAFDEIREIQACLNKQFEAIFVTLEGSNPRGVNEAIQQGGALTLLIKKCTEQHVHRLEIGKCHVQAGVIYLDALGHLERVGDHLVNIAERAGAILEVTSA